MVNVAAGVVHDTAGNLNTVGAALSRTYDSQAPTVTISSTASSPINISPIPVTITFSEAVTGFAMGDITVGNGKVISLSGSGTTYAAKITPAGDGIVTVNVAAGAAQDAAGNGNTAATPLSRLFDNKVPSVTISSTAGNPTNASPIPVTITFSEAVTDFVVGDITIGNGTAGNFSGSGTTYTANITPASDGTVTINVAAGVAKDAVGNLNTAATTFSRTYDSQAPTATISSTASSLTNVSPIPVTITFSEAVTGFNSNDISVTNGTAGSLSGIGKTYTAKITPSGQGTVTVNVAAGVAKDAAGNGNTASTELSRTFDNQRPAVTISSTASGSTNVKPIPVTITFSETVTGFDSSDIKVTNGIKGTLSSSGNTYMLDITPVAQGAVTVSVAAGVAKDATGNLNAGATFSRTYDTQGPTVAISSTTSSFTNGPIPVTLTFSEAVTGFDSGDITVINGIKGTLSGSGNSYQITITPVSQGAVSVNVAAGVAQDAAGNGNTAAATFGRTYDNQAPSVTINSTASSLTRVSPIPVTITFSEAVTGFAMGDITVTNGKASSFGGSGRTYTAKILPTAQGIVKVCVAAGVAQDISGNGNTAAIELSWTYDTQKPAVTIISTTASSSNVSPLPVTLIFSEAVTGFDSSDITVTNGMKGTLSGSGNTYKIDITPLTQGVVTVSVAAGVAEDAAGNLNTVAVTLGRTFDNIAPTVTISSTAPSSTNKSPIPVTFTFSEAVSWFADGDITVAGGTVSGFSGSGKTYTAKIIPFGQGAVMVNVAAGVAQDSSGNGNTAATELRRIFILK